MSWWDDTISLDVDRASIAEKFAESIDYDGPYGLTYNGCDCELVLIKHKEPAKLDLVLKAIDLQRDCIKTIRDILDESKDIPDETQKSLRDLLGKIIGVTCALEREWKDCYQKLKQEERGVEK